MSARAEEYLLTDATFHYSGASEGTIEVPEGEPGFRTILPAGDYGLELLDGWRLQRNTAAGFVPIAAELVSDKPALFSIQASQVRRSRPVQEPAPASSVVRACSTRASIRCHI